MQPPDPITEWFEERAAIREYEGGMTRSEAEHFAYWDARREFGKENMPKEMHERYLAAYNKRRGEQGELF